MIKVTIHKELTISDLWCSDEDFKEMGLETFIEMIDEEDPLSFLEECGGFKGLITKVEIVGDKA